MSKVCERCGRGLADGTEMRLRGAVLCGDCYVKLTSGKRRG